MAELTVEIPGLLKQDIGKIKKEVSELIFLEEKRKIPVKRLK